MRLSRLLILALALLSTPAAAQMPATGGNSPWTIAPYFFPRGALIAFLSGNPNLAEPFEVELAFPKGYRMMAHSHRNAIHVQVKQGSLLVGIGDRFNIRRTQATGAGDTATVPAGAKYYYAAAAMTIIHVWSVGPFEVHYARPEDDPSRSTPFLR